MWTRPPDPEAGHENPSVINELGRSDLELYTDRVEKDWLAGLPADFTVDVPQKKPVIISVGGGKGGVGKSLLSANLAASLGQLGFKVLLIDLDFGGANLHTYFGLGLPKKTLADFILKGQYSFAQIITETPLPKVMLAAGGRDEAWADAASFGTGTFTGLWDALIHSREQHDFDFIIQDLGAGTHRYTIDFFTSSHLGIIIVLPEPTSIENAYSFLNATLWKLVENVGMQLNTLGEAESIRQVLFSKEQSITRRGSHSEKLDKIRSHYPATVDQILRALSGRQIGFVINQIRSQRDIDLGHSMETICRKYFGFQTCDLGYLNYDDSAWKALRNRRLLSLDFPHSLLNRRVGEVTRKTLSTLGYGGPLPCQRKQ